MYCDLKRINSTLKDSLSKPYVTHSFVFVHACQLSDSKTNNNKIRRCAHTVGLTLLALLIFNSSCKSSFKFKYSSLQEAGGIRTVR